MDGQPTAAKAISATRTPIDRMRVKTGMVMRGLRKDLWKERNGMLGRRILDGLHADVILCNDTV